MATGTLDQAQHDRVAAAIRDAEQRTSGEIYCVVARASDSYFHHAAVAVSAGLLAAGLAVALVLEARWLNIGLSLFAGIQLLALATALCVLHAFPGLRIRLVPRRWRYRQAHDNALRQFLARNVHITAERTGILIFVSLAERYAEVVADAGINARLPQKVWDDVVAGLVDHARQDRLADGFVAAIATVGALLAEEFPIGAGDANELDDHLVEI